MSVATQVERVIAPTRPTKQPSPTTPLHTDKEYLYNDPLLLMPCPLEIIQGWCNVVNRSRSVTFGGVLMDALPDQGVKYKNNSLLLQAREPCHESLLN
jgi:hypothetical protein